MALAAPLDWAGLDAPRSPRRGPWVAWLVLAALVVGFAACAAAAYALQRHPLASDGLPERIRVDGRDYDHGDALSPAQVAAEPQPWTSLGDVGPHHAAVFAPGAGQAAPGSDPTGVLVETSPGAYVSYSLVGGP
ncbi:hypothetical protein [Cellulomonas alba]|uniref:Uncharacterized protein n=1 Tax=Cellulomonas alba TaxID=3053467 RepID=A0ABT7SCF5_9CELL|nr:hypothetical protein [Cellulomonas alba]MDM7853816.1 hypothetical protein [Cellulomonas alba]